ncbi:MAG: hypothetical protein LLG44_06755 [Chloroflexi bacterium]|nr:hypothetical protein [Chloroflexota bacterium]
MYYKKVIRNIIIIAFLAMITWIAYGFSIRLPFFFDDITQFRWLSTHNWISILTSAQTPGYYRPLPFIIWKSLVLICKNYYAPLLHAVNIFLHLLNAVLVYKLAHECVSYRKDLFGVAVAVLFILYPFSYQNIPFIGSLTHPLVLAIMLGAILLFLKAYKRNSKTLLFLSYILSFMAPFAHETGVLLPGLLTLVLYTDKNPPKLRTILQRTWPFWLTAFLGFTIWLLVPKQTKSINIFDLQRIWQNIIYFVQGLAYPIAPLATLVARVMKVTDLQAIILTVFPFTVIWCILVWRAGLSRLLILSIGWFVLSIAPACLLLDFNYVIDGPRLLYSASLGAAIFWATPIELYWHSQPRRITGAILAALLVFGSGLSSYLFIRERQAMYEQMRLAVAELESATASDDEKPILVVNFPAWLAPLSNTYELGHEGITIVPDYSTLTDLMWLQTGEERNIQAVILPDVQHSWRYHYVGVGKQESLDSIQALEREAQKVIQVGYKTKDIQVRNVGELEQVKQAVVSPVLGSFADQIALTLVSGEIEKFSIQIELRWYCLRQVSQDVTVFLHLYNEQGQLVAQSDGYPLRDMSRPIQWEAGDVWRDYRILPLPENLASGKYIVKVGLYPVAGGNRLGAVDRAGQQVQDDALPIFNVEITGESVTVTPLD